MKKKVAFTRHLQDLKGSNINQGQRYWTWQAIVVESTILTYTYKESNVKFQSSFLYIIVEPARIRRHNTDTYIQIIN